MCYIGEPKRIVVVDPLELPCAMPNREVEPEPEPQRIEVPVLVPVEVNTK
jgi:hypothetical protein